MRAAAAFLSLSLALAAPGAQAATQVDALSVLPNPATVHGSAPAQVEITVEVNRGPFDRQACDVLIETGDGNPPIRLSFARGDERKTVRYAFTTPGSYRYAPLRPTAAVERERPTLPSTAATIPLRRRRPQPRLPPAHLP